MQRRIPSTLLIGLLALTALSAAALPSAAFVSDAPSMTLFVQSDASGAPQLGFQPSGSEAPRPIPLLRPIATAAEGLPPCIFVAGQDPNANCMPFALGSLDIQRSFRIVGNAGLNVWLRTDFPRVVVQALEVGLHKTARDGSVAPVLTFTLASGQSAAIEALPVEVQGAPLRIPLGAEVDEPIEILEGEKLSLSIDLLRATPTSSAAPQSNLYLLSDATVLTMPVSHNYSPFQFDGMLRGDRSLGIYLANGSVSFQQPSGESHFTASVVADAAPEELVWGASPLDENVTILGEGVFTILMRAVDGEAPAGPQAPPGAAPTLQFAISVHIGDKAYTTTLPFAVAPITSLDGTLLFTGPVQLPKLEVAAGTPVKVGISVVGQVPSGGLEVLYGSSDYPSGVLLPTFNGYNLIPPAPPTEPMAPSPAPSSPAPSPTPSAEPSPTPAATEPAGDDEQEPAQATAPVAKDVSDSGKSPGLGVVAVLALAAIALALRRRTA